MNNFNFKNIPEFLLYKLQVHGFSILFSIIIIIIAFFAIKWARKAIDSAFKHSTNYEANKIRIIKKLVTYSIIGIAIILILGKFNISLYAIYSLIASSLIGGGLALQSFLSNVAKSVQLKLMHPFKEGDLIEVDSKKGRVEKVDYMHTHITTEDEGYIMIPNYLISDKSIVNYSRHKNAINTSNRNIFSKNKNILNNINNKNREKV